MATNRFSKSRLVEDLRQNAARLESAGGFDRNNGTSQLRSASKGDASTQALIDRAVAYGRWMAYVEIADRVDAGSLGVG